MHGYIHGISSTGVNSYSAAALERTAAAQQASETRRKLLDASREVRVGPSVEDELTIGSWSGEGSRQQGHQQQTPVKKEAAAGELEPFVIEPISVWA